MNKKRRKIIILILSILVLAASFLFYRYKTRIIPVKLLDYQNNVLNFKLSYPETLKSSDLSAEDQKSKTIFRVTQNQPSSLFSIRYESGLGVLRLAQKGTVLEVLKQNFDSQYPARFPDFKKQKEETITVDGVEAAQYYFTYLGKDNQTRMRERFVIMTKEYQQKELGIVGLFFSFQSKESDSDKENSDFQKILDSFKFL